MKKNIIQYHHLSYNPEIVVPIYKGEHYLITLLNRHKKISLGFIKSLKVFIALNENEAEDLAARRADMAESDART